MHCCFLFADCRVFKCLWSCYLCDYLCTRRQLTNFGNQTIRRVPIRSTRVAFCLERYVHPIIHRSLSVWSADDWLFDDQRGWRAHHELCPSDVPAVRALFVVVRPVGCCRRCRRRSRFGRRQRRITRKSNKKTHKTNISVSHALKNNWINN